jgi:hypothetical protein
MDGKISQSLYRVFSGTGSLWTVVLFFYAFGSSHITGVHDSHWPAADMEAKNIDWDTIVNLLPDGDGDEADEQRK